MQYSFVRTILPLKRMTNLREVLGLGSVFRAESRIVLSNQRRNEIHTAFHAPSIVGSLDFADDFPRPIRSKTGRESRVSTSSPNGENRTETTRDSANSWPKRKLASRTRVVQFERSLILRYEIRDRFDRSGFFIERIVEKRLVEIFVVI